jgi:hypothetical protein
MLGRPAARHPSRRPLRLHLDEAGDVVETFLEVPERAVPGSVRLTVALAPSLDTAILDAITYLDLYPYGCVEQTVHRFLPATWARSALVAVGSPDAKRLGDLDAAIRAATGRLRNLANDDGSFGWFRGGSGDVTMTSFALLGLREAARLGAPGAQDLVNRTAAALLRIVRQAPDDVQALAHWALAAVDRPDVEAYQITFRRRTEELSVVGLAWMTFAALENGRNFDAEDLVRLLLARRQEEGALTLVGPPGPLPAERRPARHGPRGPRADPVRRRHRAGRTRSRLPPLASRPTGLRHHDGDRRVRRRRLRVGREARPRVSAAP